MRTSKSKYANRICTKSFSNGILRLTRNGTETLSRIRVDLSDALNFNTENEYFKNFRHVNEYWQDVCICRRKKKTFVQLVFRRKFAENWAFLFSSVSSK